MTDFTAQGAIHEAPQRARTAPLKREYYAYFGLIFLAALPLAFLTWGLGALRRMEIPAKGPIARAWTQARIITPHIFSA